MLLVLAFERGNFPAERLHAGIMVCLPFGYSLGHHRLNVGLGVGLFVCAVVFRGFMCPKFCITIWPGTPAVTP